MDNDNASKKSKDGNGGCFRQVFVTIRIFGRLLRIFGRLFGILGMLFGRAAWTWILGFGFALI